ncbi:hypothetical protein [Candidatus Xianfuyuplasma coldseepsis]|uniref:Uncharacterized protein n=1 Tax=Candidatus Xianfuyuplasma coldseepsis TaxID=2782163 RepID=A0A7L7KS77_9MOLU|nr:hypothetical protein [Xianfuyuplasma coldseepsis]QMS85455.1 hypothetical protein G4Z02_06735 [Xianfuyuplasma coldseepsis]
MGFKEQFEKERSELQNVKRPYETAAFLIFAVMFIQQIGYWVLRTLEQLKDIKDAAGAWNPSFSTNLPTTPAFVTRIINIDATKWLWVIVGFLALALWYFLIYLFVWRYCQNHGYAKWTWTVLIVFLPTTLFLVPVYVWYAIYVFRPYIMRFLKRAVVEFKEFNPNHQFTEEVEEVEPPKQPMQEESE